MKHRFDERNNELRKKAEKWLKDADFAGAEFADMDTKRLIAELKTHQAELEIQNQELRSTRNELEEERNRFAELFDQAPVGYVILDAEERILEVNRAGEVILDYEQKFLVGHPLEVFFSPAQWAMLREYHARVREVETEQTCQVRLETVFGWRDFRLHSRVIRQGDGPHRLLTAITDITELQTAQRKMEAALSESRRQHEEIKALMEQFRLVSESTNSAIFIYSVQGYRFVNSACEKITGYSKEELLEMELLSLVPEEDRGHFEEKLQGMMQTEEPSPPFEMRIINRNGKEVWLENTINRILDGGKPALLCTAVDITLRKKREEELTAQLEHRTAELMDALHHLEMEVKEREAFNNTRPETERDPQGLSQKLKDLQIAFNVILEKQSEDREIMEENIRANLKHRVFPEIERLKSARLDARARQSVETIEDRLHQIVSPLTAKLSSAKFGLTATEVKVADRVKEGRTNDEIADVLNMSVKTVEYHRNNIRKKLGIKNTRTNLYVHLNSLDQ
jgi:PAS domain S-box-containing protein